MAICSQSYHHSRRSVHHVHYHPHLHRPSHQVSTILNPPLLRISLHTFSEDNIVELELLRDEEIDSLVDRKLIPRKDQWSRLTLRSLIIFPHEEVTLEVTTGHP